RAVRRVWLVGLYAPGGEAVCVESCGLQGTHVRRQAGDYTIRIGLARAEARRGGRVSYTLQGSLGPPERSKNLPGCAPRVRAPDRNPPSPSLPVRSDTCKREAPDRSEGRREPGRP